MANCPLCTSLVKLRFLFLVVSHISGSFSPTKYQGIGLFLCKNLIELMDGEISLDPDYDSGVPNLPGTRFVINLKSPRIEHHNHHQHQALAATAPPCLSCSNSLCTTESSDEVSSTELHLQELPESLSVLLVDDDAIIRKMLIRAIRNVAPGWNFREAASGEAALQLTETQQFDLCFMDMYMASVEKQMLGTETVTEMRNRGITDTVICGLSANDKEVEFLAAGSDCFMLKPFPCGREQLASELFRILSSASKRQS